MTGGTNGERLTRIEVLLEAAVSQRAEDRSAMQKTIEEMASDIKAIRKDLDAHKAELESFKNKGSGILIGVGLAAGGIGAGIVKLWHGVFG